MRIVVLGGAGFIGSAVCRHLVAKSGATVLNVDKLGPTSSLASLGAIAQSPRYSFRKTDICDRERVTALLNAFAPDAIVHAAAELEASPRIGGAAAAIETNVTGTWRVLEAAREHWSALPEPRRARFRFVSVSSLHAIPSPAAATRAAADALVTGWHASYGLPTIVSRAARTFGPYQFPDAAVPASVIAAIEGAALPTADAGAGAWLYVEDHARAIALLLDKGTPGVAYEVAGRGRIVPEALAERIAGLVERHGPKRDGNPRPGLLQRSEAIAAPAHNPRPADNSAQARLEQDTGWRPEASLDEALSRTVRWYLANEAWWRPLEAAQAAGNDYGVLRIA